MHPKDAPTASSDAVLRDVLDGITALRNGRFFTHIDERLPGIGGQIAKEFNALLEMLQTFRNEHHRIMEEVGVCGRLGGQMDVQDANGAWKEMLDDTNRMAGNMTAQYRDGWNTARALATGDLSARMTCQLIGGEFREFRERFNELAGKLEEGARETVEA
jgi:hypothetical protein